MTEKNEYIQICQIAGKRAGDNRYHAGNGVIDTSAAFSHIPGKRAVADGYGAVVVVAPGVVDTAATVVNRIVGKRAVADGEPAGRVHAPGGALW